LPPRPLLLLLHQENKAPSLNRKRNAAFLSQWRR
jgi:hypothetical protein